MFKGKLFWKLFFGQSLILMIGIIFLIFASRFIVKNIYYSQTIDNLQEKIFLQKNIIRNVIQSGNKDKLHEKIISIANNANTRVTVINPKGIVLADSDYNAANMENHGKRPEVLKAIKTGRGRDIRHSATLDDPQLYVAVPIKERNQIIGILRNSVMISGLREVLTNLTLKILWTGLAIFILLTLFIWWFAQTISKPMGEMESYAQKIARGDFSDKLNISNKSYELDSLAVALNQMAQQLNILENHRKQFVGNVSHELRTPLTSIHGFIETILESGDMDEVTKKKFLKIIFNHTIRLKNIIDDLMALSQIENAETNKRLNFTETNINNIINAAIKHCQHKAEEKNITIVFDNINDSIAKVNFQLLEQALVNLIDNAIKYGPQNSIIKLEISSDETFHSITVTDQGPGIKSCDQARIFERFYSVDKARSRELGGSGLGLAIVKHIAIVHGGTASIESEIGKGSTFKLQIPV
ncbi:MAG: ATP-binding protein [bacterium]